MPAQVDSRREAHHAPCVEPDNGFWLTRRERGAGLLQSTRRPTNHSYNLSSANTLAPEEIAATPAATAMQLALAAQQAVGAQPVSDLTVEKLQAQFEDMMTIMVLPLEIALFYLPDLCPRVPA